ncbi:hypothetical protein BD410DRAFT_785858 [Rickenella mellea]|uniref:PhoD-like phosphatase metallophosphatase domain-containing protein n=1 Tax=Rickenella mellea TaxID=50990 RepID=A0A4Y7QBM1_9AGAM|nr:hypothetical protein BD410DRAFT_785858 [Rickenella mellea]
MRQYVAFKHAVVPRCTSRVLDDAHDVMGPTTKAVSGVSDHTRNFEDALTMSATAHLTSVISTLFRIASYVFLRVIPLRSAKIILPTLYLAYLTSLQLEPVEKSTECDAKRKDLPTKISQSSLGNPITVCVFSLPTRSSRLRRISFLVNTLLLAFAVDLVVHPLLNPAHDVIFTRVGAVDQNSAKVVVRYPSYHTHQWSVRIIYRRKSTIDGVAWQDGPVMNLTVSNDWVDTARIAKLWPKTSYEYRLAHHNSSLDLLPYPSSPIPFRTFPDSRLNTGSHFRFIVTSCAMPNFPYLPGNNLRIKGFDLLAEYLWPSQGKPQEGDLSLNGNNTPHGWTVKGATRSLANNAANVSSAFSIYSAESTSNSTEHHNITHPISPPVTHVPGGPSIPAEFMLFLGDFIYADVPFYFGDDKETYRRLYRRNYASSSFRKVYEQLPIYHIYDDHEIINNFGGHSNDSTPPFPSASSAYSIYQASANYDSHISGHHFYNFRYGDIAFFVMDTRRYRSNITDSSAESHTMLGEMQITAFHTWLSEVNQTATFKFIITSVPFTSLWGYDAATDSWSAFPAEKASILNAIQSVPNVIILSGDRHEFAAIEYSGTQPAHPVLEFSTSPLSMFYVPFIRTLRMQSEINTERLLVSEEQVIKYIATGNYKWSSFEIDTRNPEQPIAQVEVMIDGLPAYQLHIAGTPVKLKTSTALGTFIPNSFKDMLDKIGFKPTKWF